MKILFLLTRSDTVGGSSIHVRDLCLKLMELGAQVSILIGGEGYFYDHLKSHQIQVHAIPDLHRNIHPLKDTRSFQHIKQWISKLDPDLVSAHSSKIGFLGRLAAHSLGKPGFRFQKGMLILCGKNFNISYLIQICANRWEKLHASAMKPTSPSISCSKKP